MIPAIFLGLTLPQLGLCVAVLARRPTLTRAAVVHACLLGCGGVLCAMLGIFGNLLFLPMQLAAWLLFLLWPTLLLASAWLLRGAQPRVASIAGFLGISLAITATWSMGVEPSWLEISRERAVTSAIAEPVTIALVADLQTDRVGAFERRVFREVQGARPDLVLFAGDYLQPRDMEAFEALRPSLRGLLEPVCREARLGCWAVRGDVDPDAWPSLFEGLNAQAVTDSRSVDLGPLQLTLLDPEDARSDAPPVPRVEGFHVVLGHAPDFALAAPPADLLLAGHIHGGQVRIPGWGPLLTLSRVPRSWATGRTELPQGGTLVVSRGLGMERGDAPRLRLGCRPELVVIELVPE